MVGSLAVLVLATATFSGGVVLLRSRRTAPDRFGEGVDREQVQGFVFVGAAALGALGLAVLVLGDLLDRAGPAEALAVLGLMAYLVYLAVAVVLIRRTARGRRPPPAQGRRRKRVTATPAATAPVAAPSPAAPSSPSRAARRPVR